MSLNGALVENVLFQKRSVNTDNSYFSGFMGIFLAGTFRGNKYECFMSIKTFLHFTIC
jgi:hypothetical protein